ncbi:uncharacterized protein [Antedon mediterranea]|uniref:uncharacterized protein n=1 Tax=Antedon mediterranea TaxID=105859 RepID=UPI003AF845C8
MFLNSFVKLVANVFCLSLFWSGCVHSTSVSLGCSNNCSWPYTTKGETKYEECTATKYKEFDCYGNIPHGDCTKSVNTCYATALSDSNIELEWIKNLENRKYNLKIKIKILRDVYHWKLKGIIILLFRHDNNRGECHHLSFSEKGISHLSFKGNTQIVFEYDCIYDLTPKRDYYMKAYATPLKQQNLNYTQWNATVRVPSFPVEDLKICERDNDYVHWKAEYVDVTPLYAGFIVQFSVAPPSCKFNKYLLHVCKVYGDRDRCPNKKYGSSLAKEVVVNNKTLMVITANYTHDKYIGTYRIKITGHESINYGIGCDRLSFNVTDSPCASNPCGSGICNAVNYTQIYNCTCDDNYEKVEGACLDTVAPIFDSCKERITKVIPANKQQTIVSWIEPTATDNVGIENVTTTHFPGSNFKVGISLVTYTAVDVNGNKAECSFFVDVVQDTIAPIFRDCKENITKWIPANKQQTVVSWIAPTATDNVGIENVTTTHFPGSNFKVGISLVTYTAVDVNEIKAECSFFVTVFQEPKHEYTIAILGGVSFGIVLLIVIGCLYRRINQSTSSKKYAYKSWPRIASSTVAEESVDMQRVKLLILYFEDAPQHKNVVLSFATFLQAHCGVDVTIHNWKTPNIISLMSWISKEMRDAKKILFISSYGASTAWDDHVHEGDTFSVQHSAYSDIFIHALQILSGDKEMHAKCLLCLFEYTNKKCIPDPLKHLVVFHLNNDLTRLFFRLHDTARDENGWFHDFNPIDQLETAEGQTFLNDIEKMKQLIETDKNWFWKNNANNVAVVSSGCQLDIVEQTEEEYQQQQFSQLSNLYMPLDKLEKESMRTDSSGFNSMSTTSFCNSMGV